MTFERYWSLVIKQWRLILICLVMVGFGTLMVSKLVTPLYQSTALIQITLQSGNTPADSTSLPTSDQLVQTEAQLATSDPVLREVVSHSPGMTIDQLTREVSATVKTNTQLFAINVLDASPKRAADLANDIAATLIKQQLQSMQQRTLQSQQRMQQELALTQQKISETASKIAALQAKRGNQPQIVALQAQLSALQQHDNQWQSSLTQLELNQAQGGSFLRVVQPAQPVFSVVQPNIWLNTGAGLAIGLLLGMVLVVLIERFDKRIRTPEVLTQMLGWPVLGTIWQARDGRDEIINPTGYDVNAESYRILRTNIGFSNADKPLRFLMVTSAMPRDGKSTIASNLAIFMAKAGKNTLLIDADLRHPTLHQKFGLPADKIGLSSAIQACGMPSSLLPPAQFMGIASPLQASAPMSLDAFMHYVDIPNLRVMPSGPLPPNPSELLDSKAMQRLLIALEYCGAEIVIFDTSPVLGLSDASILASKVDGTLVVTDISRTSETTVKQLNAALVQAGANVIGCVVNKQPCSRQQIYDADQSSQEQMSANLKNGDASHKQTGLLRTTKNTLAKDVAFHGAVRVAPLESKEREHYGSRT